jgi:hypothetical protein
MFDRSLIDIAQQTRAHEVGGELSLPINGRLLGTPGHVFGQQGIEAAAIEHALFGRSCGELDPRLAQEAE